MTINKGNLKKIEAISDEEMTDLLKNWGIEPVDEKTATPDFVPNEVIKENAKRSNEDKTKYDEIRE